MVLASFAPGSWLGLEGGPGCIPGRAFRAVPAPCARCMALVGAKGAALRQKNQTHDLTKPLGGDEDGSLSEIPALRLEPNRRDHLVNLVGHIRRGILPLRRSVDIAHEFSSSLK